MSQTDVSVEVSRTKEENTAKSEAPSTTQIDIADYISKIGDVIAQVKEFSSNAKDMQYTVNSVNFSFERIEGEYVITLNSKINIKPKTAA